MAMKPVVVKVTWDDHASYAGEYVGERGLVVQRSYGFLVDEDDAVIRIAQSYCKEDNKFSEVLALDKRAVRKVKRL